ncbi:MAG: DUF1611 domain-containing protein [Opitutaceae bacterium]|nr:DUF1611 domain-containing protein [Opitutaceae bacterium]
MHNPTDPSFAPRSPQRLAILQHGGLLTPKHGKTGLSLLRYRGDEVVAVVDRDAAGRSLREITRLPLKRDIPIVASVAEALAHKPNALAIGLAPSGGRVPPEWLVELRLAVKSGVSIWSGLHTRLGEDPEIAAAVRPGVYIWDMRREPAGLVGGTGAARNLKCKRVLFVGTDMAIGKMTAALEFDKVARARGVRSMFIGTGQAGMMISGNGMCLDAVRVDYASGAVEAEVMRYGPSNDVVWVEGQGSLLNPASTATLPLIRGTQPTHLVLVAKAGVKTLRSFEHIVIPPLKKVVALYEQVAEAAGAFAHVPVVGVALNTWEQDDATARASVEAAARETGLPCTDAVRFGPGEMLDRILA